MVKDSTSAYNDVFHFTKGNIPNKLDRVSILLHTSTSRSELYVVARAECDFMPHTDRSEGDFHVLYISGIEAPLMPEKHIKGGGYVLMMALQDVAHALNQRAIILKPIDMFPIDATRRVGAWPTRNELLEMPEGSLERSAKFTGWTPDEYRTVMLGVDLRNSHMDQVHNAGKSLKEFQKTGGSLTPTLAGKYSLSRVLYPSWGFSWADEGLFPQLPPLTPHLMAAWVDVDGDRFTAPFNRMINDFTRMLDEDGNPY